MEGNEHSRAKSVDAVVLGTLKHIKDQASDTVGADPTPYIDKVVSQRPAYHATIRMLCEERGQDPARLIDLFDRQLDYIRKAVGSEPELIDLTSASPLPPEIDFSSSAGNQY